MKGMQKGAGVPIASRRTVVKTAAWAVPVIAAVSAAPMAAASSEPVWDPDSNGTSGNLAYRATSTTGSINTVTGYQDAWLGLDGAVPGAVRIPMLSATFTRYGAWGSTPSPPTFLGPASQTLAVGTTLTVSSGFTWLVTSISSTTLVLSGGPGRIAGSATEVRTPRIRISGYGDYSGGIATIEVSLTGAGGNDSGGTSSVQVGRPQAAARRALAAEDADSASAESGISESASSGSDGTENESASANDY